MSVPLPAGAKRIERAGNSVSVTTTKKKGKKKRKIHLNTLFSSD